MKTAYQYVRISDDDQSNFSISGQQKMNEDYAAKHGIRILKTYIDDGYSAKNFNRPQWKQLEADLAKNKHKVDYLIVWKYDRLIRNVTEGLVFIEKLEQAWEVKLLSTMESFLIDPHSPYFFKLRADLLVTAEFERRIIADRSKFGIWSAKSQGRFLGVAPFGYNNARDENKKPIIVINELEKPIVEQIFVDFLNDLSFPMIMRSLRQKGFPLKGHDTLVRLLSNHVYAGLVVVPSYKDEKSTIKKGMHQEIIPEDMFWRAYYKLKDKIKPQGPKTIDENIPLRGLLVCQTCGRPHTGAKSKGKRNYYYYYRCQYCRDENYNAERAHDELIQILQKLSIKGMVLKQLQEECEKQLNEELSLSKLNLEQLTRERSDLKAKIDSLDEKYIENKIGEAAYQKWSPIYQKNLRMIENNLAELKKDDNEVRELFKQNLPLLEDLLYLYQKSDVAGKQTLLKGIFPGCLIKEKEGYGTPYVNSLFSLEALPVKGLLKIKKMGKPGFDTSFPISTQDGT